MSPAPTIRLASAAAAGSPPTMALPKATVQLQAPTQPLGSSFPSQAQTLEVDDEEEEGGNEGLANILSGVGLAAALIVLVVQLMTASTWISAADNPKTGEWMQLLD